MKGVFENSHVSLLCVVIIVLIILFAMFIFPKMRSQENFGDKRYRKLWCAHPIRGKNCAELKNYKSFYPSAKDGACWSACVMPDDLVESFGDARFKRDDCANEKRGADCAAYMNYSSETPPNGKDILCWSSCIMPDREEYKKY